MVLNRTFQKWLDFLLFANDEEKTIVMLLEYFSYQFSLSPESAYQFLQFFKKLLHSLHDANARKQLACKYLSVLSFLCERLNFYREKRELDDLCFSWCYPQEYQNILLRLEQYEKRSSEILEQVQKEISMVLKSKALKFEIIGRFKNIYSIYQKLQKKDYEDLFHIRDIFGFRIIIPSENIEDCFEVLHALHEVFLPDVDSFKDYITIPKINGYQSLHTGLRNIIPELDSVVEVQIRTKSMHEFSQFGLAAHCLYSQKKKAHLAGEYERKILGKFSNDHVEKKLYCFSNQGDIFLLEKGNTAHDFAYKIHSHIGKNAEYAIINGQKKALDSLLEEGDIIQIITR